MRCPTPSLVESWHRGHPERSEAREGLLAEIRTIEELEAWLTDKPRDVATTLAVRAALRILPIAAMAYGPELEEGFFSDLMLPIFHATAAAWATAAIALDSETARAAGDFSLSLAANVALDVVEVSQAATLAASAAFYAADDQIAAISEATEAFAFVAPLPDQEAPIGEFELNAALLNAATGAQTDHSFWIALSIDAARLSEGASTSIIARSPLWPNRQPDRLLSLWRYLKTTLHRDEQNWEVWTDWYEARLTGKRSNKKLEIARATIPDEIWKQGPAVVNARIKELIAEHAPKRRSPEKVAALPNAIENVPSAVSFGWTTSGTIAVVSGAINWPAFPFGGGQDDHKQQLDACRALAAGLARSLRNGRWNARRDYADTLDEYLADLPQQPREGNFLLADAAARTIRAMFADEVDSLPLALAAKLQVLLEQHIGLRAYYPQTETFYQSVRSGHLEQPLPIDAVAGFIETIRAHTPTRFEPMVANTLETTAKPIPALGAPDPEARWSGGPPPRPPQDPLGEVDSEKSHQFTMASGANELFKVLESGEKVKKGLEGWGDVAKDLAPYAAPIIQWLRIFLGGS